MNKIQKMIRTANAKCAVVKLATNEIVGLYDVVDNAVFEAILLGADTHKVVFAH